MLTRVPTVHRLASSLSLSLTVFRSLQLSPLLVAHEDVGCTYTYVPYCKTCM